MHRKAAPALLVGVLVLSGCGGGKSAGREAPGSSAKTIDPPRSSDVYEDKFEIGRRMDGPVATDQTDVFDQGQTIHVSFVVQNGKPGTECRVQWTRLRDNAVVAEEKKPLPAKTDFISFHADTSGWEPGKYLLVKQVTGDDPNTPWRGLGTKDFTIRPK